MLLINYCHDSMIKYLFIIDLVTNSKQLKQNFSINRDTCYPLDYKFKPNNLFVNRDTYYPFNHKFKS